MEITTPLLNVTRTDTEPCCFSLQVEVPAAQVKKAYGQALVKVGAKVRLPGFRPGKVPTARLIKHFAKDIESEARDELINETFKQAIGEQKVKLALNPKLDEKNLPAVNPEEPFIYKVDCEFEPEFTLPEYKGVKLTRKAVTVSDEEVEEYLDNMLESRAKLQQVERPAELGDFLKVSYTAALPEGFEVPENCGYLVKAENGWMGLRDPELLPGTKDKMLGAAVGAEVNLEVAFPEDFREGAFAGKTLAYTIKVLEIQAAVKPELNDEFAQTCQADNVEELKNRTREMLRVQKTRQREDELRNTLLESLMAQLDFPLPPTIVKYNQESVLRDIVRNQQRNGVSEEKIRADIQEHMGQAEEVARRQTRFQYVITAIAEAEDIKVENEEMGQEINYMAQMNRSSVKKTVRDLRDNGQLEQMFQSIRVSKTIDRLIELADITEE